MARLHSDISQNTASCSPRDSDLAPAPGTETPYKAPLLVTVLCGRAYSVDAPPEGLWFFSPCTLELDLILPPGHRSLENTFQKTVRCAAATVFSTGLCTGWGFA